VAAAKMREAEERLDKAYTTLSRIHETKVHWLMKRIFSLAPDSPDLRRFERVCFMLHADLVVTASARYMEDEPASETSDRVDQCDKNRRLVIVALEELSGRPSPPRQPSPAKIRTTKSVAGLRRIVASKGRARARSAASNPPAEEQLHGKPAINGSTDGAPV
jgi:hypothetical protein